MISVKDEIVSKSVSKEPKKKYSYCSLQQVANRVFLPGINAERERLILVSGRKWVNGTVLHYYFFDKSTDGENVVFSDGTREFISWTTSDAEKNVVRAAFEKWKELGTGLDFREVNSRDEAEIRIGFMKGDGSWSKLGRDVLEVGRDQRTMNFGWDLTRDNTEIDTAIHEIGHTLGFPHEHQNPNAGIVWNEEAVYRALAQPPNNWDRQTTYYNIIRKISADTVQGSNWDPNSIMHYPFESGLIMEPTRYQEGLQPAGGLSPRDITWMKTFYPPLKVSDYKELKLLQSEQLDIADGQQLNFCIKPTATRDYEFRTFGESDVVMVLFEKENEKLQYRTADDDSGEQRNAYLKVKLISQHQYVLRVRLYYADRKNEIALMMW
jgi:hypothetical protein